MDFILLIDKSIRCGILRHLSIFWVLYKINYTIKSSLKIDDDPIKVNKSSFDKTQ
jgi:hypothetical protein